MGGGQTEAPSQVCAPNPLMRLTQASDPSVMGVIYDVSLKLKGLSESLS